MKTGVIIGILTLCLVVIIAWGVVLQYNNQVLSADVMELQETVAERNVLIDQWHNEYESLSRHYDQLGEYYSQSQVKVNNLEQQVMKLEQDITGLEQEVLSLRQQAVNLRDSYERQLDYRIAEAERAKFTFYYVPMSQRYGVDDLQDYLQRWQWKESAYVENKFDCSQMSAYLEWKLENEGYHTVIVAGDSPSGGGKHAWLLVEASKGKYMPVEATAYSIVYWSSPYFNNYFTYEHRFETIQDALIYSKAEFNWWDVAR